MKVKRNKPRLTPIQREALTLYATLKAIKLSGMADIAEQFGGKKQEYYRGAWKLCRLLGLKKNIWLFNPVETDTPNPPFGRHLCAYDQWLAGWAARCRLEKMTSSL